MKLTLRSLLQNATLKDAAHVLHVSENGIGDLDIETYTKQGAIGALIIVAPMVEVRPEFRIVDTERYRSNRYAMQFHIFY